MAYGLVNIKSHANIKSQVTLSQTQAEIANQNIGGGGGASREGGC